MLQIDKLPILRSLDIDTTFDALRVSLPIYLPTYLLTYYLLPTYLRVIVNIDAVKK